MRVERPERSDLPASDEVPGGPFGGLAPTPPPHGPSRTPDVPGAPLFLRPAAIVPTVILLLLVLRAVFHI
jgi:hypothetical protein